ncbi:hypothetical protein EV189_4051 [Motilibacter rhizosphaerae]|uniref:Uncharacterized protein n=1 Tax=Motilibacter rhizosphaerae TaxID=598652 RepID=A0A4Q7N754_9ACTN|nr:hypothetical protein EV189_4051 [Motilibacter rhizosphaerae]
MVGRAIGLVVVVLAVLLWGHAATVAGSYPAVSLTRRYEDREVMLPFFALLTRGLALVAALVGVALLITGG